MTLDQLQSRLTAYLARPIGPLTVLTGGRASSLYTFTLPDDATMVLKMYAPDAGGREHALREWLALTRLRAVDHPVPRGVLVEPDARHLGQPFLVMEHVPGTSFWSAYEAAGPAARARLTQSFVARLVALHELDAALLEPLDPYDYLGDELDRLRRDGAGSPHTGLAEVVDWLAHRARTVPGERPTILHRDYHPWNVLVDPDERLWVVDWDWQIGDPRFDLAWACMLMRRSGFDAFSDAVRDGYARQSGRPLDGIAYFEVLTTVRWLLNVLPAVESEDPAGADFRAFLVEPVRRAQTFLHERTGIRLWGQGVFSQEWPRGEMR